MLMPESFRPHFGHRNNEDVGSSMKVYLAQCPNGIAALLIKELSGYECQTNRCRRLDVQFSQPVASSAAELQLMVVEHWCI